MQVEAAHMISTVLRIENIGPIILCLITGPFSDKYGRKIPLLVSCTGMAVAYSGWVSFFASNTIYCKVNLFDIVESRISTYIINIGFI